MSIQVIKILLYSDLCTATNYEVMSQLPNKVFLFNDLRIRFIAYSVSFLSYLCICLLQPFLRFRKGVRTPLLERKNIFWQE